MGDKLTKAQSDVIELLAHGQVVRIDPQSDLAIVNTGLVEAYIETERGLFTGLRLTNAGRAYAISKGWLRKDNNGKQE